MAGILPCGDELLSNATNQLDKAIQVRSHLLYWNLERLPSCLFCVLLFRRLSITPVKRSHAECFNTSGGRRANQDTFATDNPGNCNRLHGMHCLTLWELLPNFTGEILYGHVHHRKKNVGIYTITNQETEVTRVGLLQLKVIDTRGKVDNCIQLVRVFPEGVGQYFKFLFQYPKYCLHSCPGIMHSGIVLLLFLR